MQKGSHILAAERVRLCVGGGVFKQRRCSTFMRFFPKKNSRAYEVYFISGSCFNVFLFFLFF